MLHSFLYKERVTVDPYILAACESGSMPPSHRESVIILLPKEGKDTKDINQGRSNKVLQRNKKYCPS